MVFKLENGAWVVASIFIVLFAISLYVKEQVVPETKIDINVVRTEINPIETFWYNLYSQPKVALNDSNREIFCLAQNIHHEAAGEPFIGKLAVGIVTINRKNKTNKSICQIVFEPFQFSWTGQMKYDTRFSEDTWLATNLIINNLVKIPYLENAVYFHDTKIKPTWSKTKQRVAVVGGHVFYAEYDRGIKVR